MRLLCVLALDRFGDYVSDKVYSAELATLVILLGTNTIMIMPLLTSLDVAILTTTTYCMAGRLAQARMIPCAPLARMRLADVRTMLPAAAGEASMQ